MPRSSRYVGGVQDAGRLFTSDLLPVRAAVGCCDGRGNDTEADGAGTGTCGTTWTGSSSAASPGAAGASESSRFVAAGPRTRTGCASCRDEPLLSDCQA